MFMYMNCLFLAICVYVNFLILSINIIIGPIYPSELMFTTVG